MSTTDSEESKSKSIDRPSSAAQSATELVSLKASTHDLFLVLLEFLVHLIVGSAIFLAIASVAIGLNLGIHWIEGYNVSRWIIIGLTIGEYSIFGTDLYLFLVFLVKNAIRTTSKL